MQGYCERTRTNTPYWRKMAEFEVLKEFVNEETYAQLAEQLKDKDVQLCNLKTGEYVSKGKYTREVLELNQKLEALKGLEDIQGKYNTLCEEHNSTVQNLTIDLAIAKTGCIDPLVTHGIKATLKEKLATVGNIEQIWDMLEELKQANPNHFGKVPENKGANPQHTTHTDPATLSYTERLKLFNTNKKAYNQMYD